MNYKLRLRNEYECRVPGFASGLEQRALQIMPNILFRKKCGILTSLHGKRYYAFISSFVMSVLMLASFDSYTQDFSDKNEAIAAMKVSFITRKLNLTPKEAQTFWPVYNQFEEELDVLRKNHRKMLHETKDEFSQISDPDIEKLVDEQINFKQKEIDIMKKYHPQFKKILPIKKVALLYKAEEEFKRHLIKQIKGK